jgi:hypothetical protein
VLRYSSEDVEQIKVVSWFREKYKDTLIFHIPNGGKRDIITGAKMKSMGTLPGISDLCVSEALSGFHGLYVEMKASEGGRVTSAQADVLKYFNSKGYAAVVCHGSGPAKEFLELYMSDSESAVRECMCLNRRGLYELR